MLPRRAFLALISGGALAAAMRPTMARVHTSVPSAPRFMGARADAQGRYFATAFDLDGHTLLDIPLPARGHGIGYSSRYQNAAICARRPGSFLVIADMQRMRVLHTLSAAPQRVFNGHAVYLGDYLYASETTLEAIPRVSPALEPGDGVIGVYAVREAYRRVAEFPSYGLDPHDLRGVDAHTLVVANGGLLTHPDAPRVNLNVDSMQPTLAYIDVPSGRLKRQLSLPPEHHQLSIRHLAVAPDRSVAIAMQYEGPSTDRPPLIALHRPESAQLQLVELPDAVLRGLRNYCGSAAVDASGQILGVSSPRGGQTVFIDLRDARFMHALALADGCGISATTSADSFLLSSGLGGILNTQLSSATSQAPHTQPLRGALLAHSHWDNHLTPLF